MEKTLSLTYEEATALLDMSLFTILPGQSEAGDRAIRKLGELCREFSAEDSEVDRVPVSRELGCLSGV